MNETRQRTTLDFAVVGAMKAGTTSLFDALSDVDRIFMPPAKELHYFSQMHRVPLAWYEHQFRDRRPGQIVGEASTSYSWTQRYPEVPARMARLYPDLKIVFLLRDPIERMVSEYHHLRLNGLERRPFAESLAHRDEYWERSDYRVQLDAYLAHFPDDHVLTVPFDTDDDRATGLAAVLEFIGLDRSDMPGDAVLPHSYDSEDRSAVPWVVGRLAISVPGTALRWTLPQRTVKTLKSPLSRNSERGRIPRGSADEARALFPDRCRNLDDSYRELRRRKA